MSIESDWLGFVLQTNDSAFPIGGYAHSMGLEEVVRLGVVTDEKSLLQYCRQHSIPALEHFEIPMLLAVHATADDLGSVIQLDHQVDGQKPAAELRRASIAAGKRRLEMVTQLFPSSTLENFSQAVKNDRTPCHHLTVFALVYAPFPAEVATIAYAHQALTGLCLSAMKLLRFGQDGAQRVLTAAMSTLNVRSPRDISPEVAGWFDPLTDIASMRHEIAFERLFIS